MLEEIQKPLGDFIINNAEGVRGSDGVYYHYSEVCKLLRLYKKEILNGETVKRAKACPECECNKLQHNYANHFTCLNALCDWQGKIE